jgi:hypothetical protein
MKKIIAFLKQLIELHLDVLLGTLAIIIYLAIFAVYYYYHVRGIIWWVPVPFEHYEYALRVPGSGEMSLPSERFLVKKPYSRELPEKMRTTSMQIAFGIAASVGIFFYILWRSDYF